MVRIAGDAAPPSSSGVRNDAAADAAIWAGRSHRLTDDGVGSVDAVSRSDGDCASSSIVASIDILLIAAGAFEVRNKSDRLVDAARAMLRHYIDKRALHVLRHAFRVAADINMRAIGKP